MYSDRGLFLIYSDLVLVIEDGYINERDSKLSVG